MYASFGSIGSKKRCRIKCHLETEATTFSGKHGYKNREGEKKGEKEEKKKGRINTVCEQHSMWVVCGPEYGQDAGKNVNSVRARRYTV